MRSVESTADITAEYLIVGAGPAGCAAAITLARAGKDVLLIDQHDFPRDKTCGDGLIPDSMHALEALGLLDTVRGAAKPVKGLTCHGPRGGTLHIPGDLAVLPRKTLDNLLFQAAKSEGVRVMTPVKYIGPIQEAQSKQATRLELSNSETERNARTIGAKATWAGRSVTIHADWTILATGATPGALQSTGHCLRTLPSAMALRAYVKNPEFKDDAGNPIDHLHISWHKSYAPGYGWIFPCPDGVFNVGVGLYGMHEPNWKRQLSRLPAMAGLAPKKPNLSDLFKQFISTNAMASRLVNTGTSLGEIKGAPLRCSLQGAKPAAPGLLVTGEAMGSTYALTGEGIGKAMETGMLSAQALLSHEDDRAICAAYEQSLRDIQYKFDIYQRANKINRVPWLIDLAIARGNKSPSLVRRMSLVLEEKANPAKLFTLRGAWKFLTE